MFIQENYNAVENYLKNYTNLKILIRDLEIEINLVKNSIEGIKALEYKENVDSNGFVSSPVEESIIKKEKKIEMLTNIKREKELELERINNILTALTDEEYKLIELRYFKKLPFKVISNMLNINEIYLIQKRKRIINDKLVPLFLEYKF